MLDYDVNDVLISAYFGQILNGHCNRFRVIDFASFHFDRSVYPYSLWGGAYASPPRPPSKIPENGRLRLKLWIYNEDGLKLQKNPNQFHMKS